MASDNRASGGRGRNTFAANFPRMHSDESSDTVTTSSEKASSTPVATADRRMSVGLSRSDPSFDVRRINRVRNGGGGGGGGEGGKRGEREAAGPRRNGGGGGSNSGGGGGGGGGGRYSWRNKLRQPCDIIQTQIVMDKATTIRRYMKRLEQLSEMLAESKENDFDHRRKSYCYDYDYDYEDDIGSMCNESEMNPQETEFIDIVMKTKEEIHSIFTFVEFLLKERLTDKEILSLREVRTEFNPGQDISVRFLGVNWREMDGLVTGVISQVSGLCEAVLGQRRLQREHMQLMQQQLGMLGLGLPEMLVRDLNRIKEDLFSHAEAVLNGRLNRQRNAIIREQQNRHRDFLEDLRRRQSTMVPLGRKPLFGSVRRLLLPSGWNSFFSGHSRSRRSQSTSSSLSTATRSNKVESDTSISKARARSVSNLIRK